MLFQAATLSAWGDMYMVAAYGCDQYDSYGGYEVRNTTREIRTLAGTFNHWDCVDPTPMPVTAALFFYSYTLLTAFVVLSLFISVITTAMFEVMECKKFEMQRLKELRALKHGKTRVRVAIDDAESPLRDAIAVGFADG